MTHSLLAVADSPLVFRSGRPFGVADGGGGGDSLAFPLPATTAGAVRAAWCDAAGHTHAVGHDPLVEKIHVRGPLRCTVSAAGVVEPWLPAPADAVLAEPEPRRWPLLQLTPARDGEGNVDVDVDPGCDLPFGLRPLRLAQQTPTSPAPDGWSLPALQSWLHRHDSARHGRPRVAGQPLAVDTRVHVAIGGADQRAIDRALFASQGIDFTLPAKDSTGTQGLLLYVDAPESAKTGLCALAGRHGRLGADGRTVAYVELSDHQPPTCARTLADQLDAVKAGDIVRLYLATPACFLRNGWYPDGLRPEARDPDSDEQRLRGSLPGVDGWRFELVAAAVGRFSTQAGYAMRGTASEPKGKPLRRLVPAGSVYWLRVLEKDATATKLSERWWRSTCYVEFARDGHGLGLWGLA